MRYYAQQLNKLHYSVDIYTVSELVSYIQATICEAFSLSVY